MGRRFVVRVADHAVGGSGDTLVTYGLGSCIAVVLHDPRAAVGGLAHVLLPDPSFARDRSNLAKFATTAIPLLREEMERAGASPRRMGARLVGGASMFGALMNAGSMNMGEKNLAACRRVLDELRLPIRGEQVGGDFGRSVHFPVGEGRVIVTTAMRDDVVL